MALMHVDFFANTLGMAMSMDVILPEGSQGVGVDAKPLWDGEEKLPVLYLLHGTSDDHTIWQRRTSIERYVANKKLAVVMPNAHISAYTNQKFGYRFFDFISEEVPAFCQKYFKISDEREKNFIGGLSMGGYGALKCGLRGYDTFSWAAGLSSATDIVSSCRENGQRKGLWRDIWGDDDAAFDDLLIAAQDYAKSENAPDLHLYMWCGTEDFLYDANIRFRDHLMNLGLDLTYEECPGDHRWQYWDDKIQRVLEWLPIGKEEQ